MTDVRTIAVAITADHSAVRRRLRMVGNDVNRFGGQVESVGKRMRRAWQNVGFGRVTNRLKQLGTTIGGLAGVYGFASAIKSSMAFEDSLNKLTIQGGKNIAFVGKLRNEILAVSTAHGIAKEEIAEFASGIVEATGDIDGAVAMMEKMGKVSVAFGTNMGQVSELVTQLSGNMKILPKDIDKAMAALRGQELVGTMTFAKMARQGARVFSVLPGLEKYGIKATGMAGTIAGGGLMQMAARGFGRAQSAEAASATEKFLSALGNKEKKIRKELGVEVRGRQLQDIFKDIGAVMNDIKKSQKAQRIFGERGIRVAQQLGLAYKAGWSNKLGDKASAQTIFGVKPDRQLIEESYKRAQKSPAVRFKKVMAEMQAAMHQFMIPVLEKLIDVMPMVADGLKWFLDNAKLLFNLWIGWKASGIMTSIINFFSQMKTQTKGMGQTGQGMQQGMAPAGGAGMAMPLFSMGVGIVTALGKTFIDEYYDIQDTLHKQRMGHIKREMEAVQAGRKDVARGAKLASLDIKLGLAQSESSEYAKLVQRRKQLFGLGGEWLTGRKGQITQPYEIQFGKMLKKGGTQAVERRLAEMKSYRTRLESFIQKQRPDVQLSPEEMRERVPTLKLLDASIKRFDQALNKLIRGKGINVTAKVNIGSDTPQQRSQARTKGKKAAA